MKPLAGRLTAIAGVGMALAGLLVFSLMAPGQSAGLETDVEPTDIAPTPEPTAEAPEAQSIELNVSNAAPAAGDFVVVSVTVLDEGGNPVTGTECTFSIRSQPGTDAAVNASPVTTDGNGVATAVVDVGSTAGTVAVQANCGNVEAAINVVAGAAEGPAEPPASLPDTGSGGYLSDNDAGPAQALLFSLLASLGVTLAGAGMITVGRGRRVRQD